MATEEEIAYKYEITDGDGCGTDCVFIDDVVTAIKEYASQKTLDIPTKKEIRTKTPYPEPISDAQMWKNVGWLRGVKWAIEEIIKRNK
jgi:hypothetical protein